MHPILRSILAVIVGFVVGGIVNFAIISINSMLFPLPAGTNTQDFAALREAWAAAPLAALLLTIIAHAGGALVGAWVAAKLAGRTPLIHGLIIGVLFLLGGISMVAMLSPTLWFTIADLSLYLPAAWLGASMTGTHGMGF